MVYWLQLTQANTGAKIYVNMEHVIVIAPSKTGGANLMDRERDDAKDGQTNRKDRAGAREPGADRGHDEPHRGLLISRGRSRRPAGEWM
ncbi:MAG TPA: hypothetical protein VE993_01280 [Stellaceae bacterium]|nr:hypothetical protein [Stellaceae bacterium]